VGGSISYTYIGQEGGKDKYEILVDMYRDCTSKTDFDNLIELGFYENKAPYPLVDSLGIVMYSRSPVDPPAGGSNCSFAPSTCLERALYKGVVLLPHTDYGYHVEHSRCCRNTMQNIPDNEGYMYYAFIPPSIYKNSSPYFNQVPAPYICTSDTVQLENTATESDGDSLAFKLTLPLSGGSEQHPIPAVSPYFSTPQSVDYYSGYSYLKPFGPGGYASVDPRSGISTVYVPPSKAGRYVFAIEVDEYRNGQLIAFTRRDIQLIATACPPNPAPTRVSVSGSSGNSIYLTGGDKLDFNFQYNDPNFNQLSYTVGGTALAEGAKVTATSGSSTLKGSIQWNTACNQGRTQPYTVSIKVQDNGCPPKAITDIYYIYIKPFVGTTILNGPTDVCYALSAKGQPTYYTSVPRTGGKLIWKAINGRLLSDTGRTIGVLWDNVASGTIEVVEVNANGCAGDTVKKNVVIHAPPQPGKISGAGALCLRDTTQYTVKYTSGSTYHWIVQKGFVLNGDGTNKVTVVWTRPDTGMVAVVEQSSIGCLSDTSKLTVFVSVAKIKNIIGPQSVCPYSKNIDYWVDTPQVGSVYRWYVIGGNEVSGGMGPHIKINWLGVGSGKVKVIEITRYGCPGDTLSLSVTKEYNLVTPAIKGPAKVCEFAKAVHYSVINSTGSTYTWKILGGDIVSGAGTSEVVVDWDTARSAFISVTQTAWDSVDNQACVGAEVSKIVEIKPKPRTKGIFGPTSTCATAVFPNQNTDTVKIYSVSGYDSSIYIWRINGSTNFKGNNFTNTIHPALDSPGVYTIDVTELTKDSCAGNMLNLVVQVHPVPATSGIAGDTIVCAPYLAQHVYSVKGFPTSVYNWNIDGGKIVSGNGTRTVMVDWLQEGHRSISVQEVSEFGCPGEVKRQNIKVDSLMLDINLVTTTVANDKLIEVDWTKHNGTFLKNKLLIYRAVANGGSGYYLLIDSVDNDRTSYIDKKVETGKYSYYYKIAARNSCGSLVQSTPHRSVLLQGQKLTDSTISMVWNKYEGWPFGVDHYELTRNINDGESYHFLANRNDTNYYMQVGLDGFRQCFRVAATKAQDSSLISWSNILCFNFDPYVYIPNVFTPDNNFLNDSFKVFVHNYKSYHMDIYNRWGEHIFSSDDPSVIWDGTFKGKRCPMDVYVWLVNVQGSEKNIYKKGTVTLIR
jgi:gliding motility-associated-like protein